MSLCGGGNQKTTTTTTIPPWLETAVKGLIGQGQTLAQTPYQAYAGPRVAGFSPDQLQAFGQVRNNQGNYQPYLDQANQTFGQVAGQGYTPYQAQEFTSDQAQKYMSPYTQNVIDSLTSQMNRQRDIQAKSLGDAAAKSGGFGGYRQGVTEAENTRNWNDLTNQAVAQQYQNAFTNAQSQFNADQQRGLGAAQLNNQANLGQQGLNLQAGQGLAGLGQLTQNLGQSQAQNLLGIGGLQQALGQQGLDVGYQNYQAAQQWPFQTTGFLSDIIHGAPSGQTSVTSQPGPSTLSTLLGLGVGGLSLAGGMGAFG